MLDNGISHMFPEICSLCDKNILMGKYHPQETAAEVRGCSSGVEDSRAERGFFLQKPALEKATKAFEPGNADEKSLTTLPRPYSTLLRFGSSLAAAKVSASPPSAQQHSQ